MEQPSPVNNRIYFPNLDGFRTIAFLMVFFAHCYMLFDFGERTVVIKVINRIFGKANVGVNFFFVLSGFLISYLVLSEQKAFNKIDIRAFYIRRILRIWPVYFAVISIAFILSYIHKPFYSLHDASPLMIGSFLTNFSMAYSTISSLPITVLWSVAVEEQFYLVLPLLIFFFGRKIFYLFPLFILISVVFRLLHANNIFITEFHTVSVCSSLFAGCITAYLVLFHNFSRWFINFKKLHIIAVYLAFFIIHIFRENFFSARFDNIYMYLGYAVFFCFFIMEQNYSKHSFFKMSNSRLLSSVGKYTYGLYAYHMIFITLLMVFIPARVDPGGNYFIYFSIWAVALAASFIFARLSYQFMEKPFLMLKEKFSRT